MRIFFMLAACSTIALIAGCKTAPQTQASSGATPAASQPPSSAKPAANAATKAAAAKANLAIEKLRLAELFRGTPVLFVLQPDGSLRVDVPLHFSFDSGKAVVKPPLGAVLDRIAAGQLHEATKLVVAAPADPASKGLELIGARAASVHDYLVARGLVDARVAVAGAAGAAVVRVVVSEMPAL